MTGMNVNAYNYAGSPLEHRTADALVRSERWMEGSKSKQARSLARSHHHQETPFKDEVTTPHGGGKGEHCIATQNNWQLMETHYSRLTRVALVRS